MECKFRKQSMRFLLAAFLGLGQHTLRHHRALGFPQIQPEQLAITHVQPQGTRSLAPLQLLAQQPACPSLLVRERHRRDRALAIPAATALLARPLVVRERITKKHSIAMAACHNSRAIAHRMVGRGRDLRRCPWFSHRTTRRLAR